MHRLIVTARRIANRPDFRSRTPRMSIRTTILLARQNRRRLDGEAIRDALLAVSGQLNPALGGPGVFPPLPPELTKLSSKGRHLAGLPQGRGSAVGAASTSSSGATSATRSSRRSTAPTPTRAAPAGR